ncbi:MAG TPA: neutral/alkaline non-lysosomal ceramidase N-terminal domain-containing protein [bacterium]|nr:neutral/alkaline non-lysosomal ceramidase N-terminal domain-containing protein [bacterium]
MRGTKRWLIAVMVLCGLLSWSAASFAQTFQAGAALADITPDVHKWKVNSIGYFSHKVMTGVHDRVYCEALAMGDGQGEAVIVTCDLMGTPPVLRRKVLDGLAGAGIGDDNLLFSCSHTHSGPGNMMPNLIARLGFGAYNEELTQWTADQIISAVKDARASMKPAVLKVAVTTVANATRNRRDPAGSYDYDTRRFSSAYDPDNPENLIDPALTVIKVDGEDGSPIALLFHFATHGTVLSAQNLDLSADWSGAARAKVEAHAPGYVVMYMNGTEGDQAPAMDQDNNSDLDYLGIIGGRVADGVIAAMDDAQPVTAVPVRGVMARIAVPPTTNKLADMTVPKALIKHYFPAMPLQAVRMGDVVFMALPVEAIASIGLTMKAGARGAGVPYPLVAGLANDHGMYAATPDQFERGGYEVDNTVFGKIEAGFLIGEQMLLARQVMR